MLQTKKKTFKKIFLLFSSESVSFNKRFFIADLESAKTGLQNCLNLINVSKNKVLNQSNIFFLFISNHV
jgi:hypothetical protein